MFRDSDQGIMFSSDVSARGMDYPDVTHVIQVGCPSDKATYVHRLGRTARAGKSGTGMLFLADFETFFLESLADLPMSRYERNSIFKILLMLQHLHQRLTMPDLPLPYVTWLPVLLPPHRRSLSS